MPKPCTAQQQQGWGAMETSCQKEGQAQLPGVAAPAVQPLLQIGARSAATATVPLGGTYLGLGDGPHLNDGANVGPAVVQGTIGVGVD